MSLINFSNSQIFDSCRSILNPEAQSQSKFGHTWRLFTASAQAKSELLVNDYRLARNGCDSRLLVPGQMKSAQGRLLMEILRARPHSKLNFDFISRIASHQIMQLRSLIDPDCRGDIMDDAMEDIMYILLVCRMMDVYLSTQHAFKVQDNIVDTHSWLCDIHSIDTQPLLHQHVSMVINGSRQRKLEFNPHDFACVKRVEMGKIYAASVMQGYMLARVKARLRLERAYLGTSTQTIGEYLANLKEDTRSFRQINKVTSNHSLQIIERHVEVLFGKVILNQHATNQTRKNSSSLHLQLAYIRYLILHALGFGALLWDIETNFMPTHL